MSAPHPYQDPSNPHVTVDVRRQARSPYEVRPLSAALAGWRWDAPEHGRPRYRRGVARPTSDADLADAENEAARAAETHLRVMGLLLALAALAAPLLVGVLAWWRTTVRTRRRAADRRRIDMPVAMREARTLAAGNLAVTAVLWVLLPVTATALLLRVPAWDAIWAAVVAIDTTALMQHAQDGALGLLAGPATGLLAVGLSSARVRGAVRSLRDRAHLRSELAASLDAALDLPTGTAHAHLGWERDGQDAIIALSGVPSVATRATHSSVEGGLAAQRSEWTVESLDYPTLRLRPVTAEDTERRRASEASGGLLAGSLDDEPTTLWQPPHAA